MEMKRILLSLAVAILTCVPALWPSRHEPPATAPSSAAAAPRTELSGVPDAPRSGRAARAQELAEARFAERDVELGTLGRMLAQ
jgi:hypothetical protein